MNVELNSAWALALKLMEKSFTEVVFDTWIKTLEPVSMDNGTFVLQTKKNFFKTTIEQRYLHEIRNSIRTATQTDVEVFITCSDDPLQESPEPVTLVRSNIQPKYVFETFVRGKSNELAYAACVAVAEAPGLTTYNPLFLYGGVGLGKTHLMHSIGNYILDQNKNTRVLYVSTETFTNELINSIKERKNQVFRDKYREIDILLIDDIQFLSEKEGTQEEFFHTFNTLYHANKQIVISSDKPPREIKTLEERLSSRFGSGLTVDITQPDFETRTAILEKKAEMDKLYIPKEVTTFIARSIVSNIRDLEGALNKISAYAKLSKTEITLELAERSLKDLITEGEKREITVELIQEVVCNFYNISIDELRSKKRSQNISYPRQIAMYLTRKLVDISLPKMGILFGGRDHSTVIHGCDKISTDLEKNPKLRNELISLEQKIRGD